MIQLTEAQLLGWLTPLLWPFLRTLSLFAAVVYVVITVCLIRGTPRARTIAQAGMWIELVAGEIADEIGGWIRDAAEAHGLPYLSPFE